MTAPAKLGYRIIFGAILIAACSRPGQITVKAESLREHFPDLLQAARAWRPDAYLETASVRIVGEHEPSYLLSAHFISPSEEFESIAIRLMADGSLSVDPLAQTIAIRHIEPITESDWALDSPELLAVALDPDGRRFLEELGSTNCSGLILERESLSAGAPVVWRVLLSDCDSPLVGQTTIINAETGELISRKSDFPTAAP